EAAARLRLVLEILPDVNRVVGRLARLRRAVVARVREPLDELVLDVPVEGRLREIPHLRRQMLQLIRQHAADLDIDAVDVAHEESDLAIAGQRQERALSEKRQRAAVLLT